MNKEKIVEESNEWSKKELGSLYSVVNDGDDLTLLANGYYVAWFMDFEKGKFRFEARNDDLSVELIKKDIIKKFYEKGIELLSKHESKYTVQVIADNPVSYLNVDKFNGKIVFGDKGNSECYRKNFTQQEIDELKKRDDVAINWDKAIIKEVE